MKNFYNPAKLDCRTEERVRRIVDLSRWRDRILEAPMLDLDRLAILAADYETANMPCAAADLRRRLEWYRDCKGERSREKKCGSKLTSNLAVLSSNPIEVHF